MNNLRMLMILNALFVTYRNYNGEVARGNNIIIDYATTASQRGMR